MTPTNFSGVKPNFIESGHVTPIDRHFAILARKVAVKIGDGDDIDVVYPAAVTL